jgi:hypothetical protein
MRFAAETINDDLATLTREQAARALGISLDTLDALHARKRGAAALPCVAAPVGISGSGFPALAAEADRSLRAGDRRLAKRRR